MTQIVLENMVLPEAGFDQYACWEELLSEQVSMISGRIVEEVRGKVWKVKWAYDYLDNQTTRNILSILRSVTPLQAAVLPDNSDQMVYGRFLVERITQPTYLCSDNGDAVWHGLGFVLREVRPHA